MKTTPRITGSSTGETTEGQAVVAGEGGAAGEVPAVGARRADLQPSSRAGFELAQPVPLHDVAANMAPQFARDAQKLQENLQRRQADQALVDELATGHFAGPRYRHFENELARYGISVLRGWMHSGYIFQLAATRKFALHPTDQELEELCRESDTREELATMTVALALPGFRERALVGRGWRFDGGAAVSTYFMGACMYVFPNQFRARRTQREKWRR
jgi:hypothetical protein